MQQIVQKKAVLSQTHEPTKVAGKPMHKKQEIYKIKTLPPSAILKIRKTHLLRIIQNRHLRLIRASGVLEHNTATLL